MRTVVMLEELLDGGEWKNNNLLSQLLKREAVSSTRPGSVSGHCY